MKPRSGKVNSGQKSHQFGSEMEPHSSNIPRSSLLPSFLYLLICPLCSSSVHPIPAHPSVPVLSEHLLCARSQMVCEVLQELTHRRETACRQTPAHRVAGPRCR